MWWGHSPGDKLGGGKTVKRERLKIQGRVIEKQRKRSEKKGTRKEPRQLRKRQEQQKPEKQHGADLWQLLLTCPKCCPGEPIPACLQIRVYQRSRVPSLGQGGGSGRVGAGRGPLLPLSNGISPVLRTQGQDGPKGKEAYSFNKPNPRPHPL